MIETRTLPCGCLLDGRCICSDHQRESVDPSIAGETMLLVAVGLFVAIIASWAAILGSPT